MVLETYLGEEAYTQAQNQGSRMTPEQVLTRAEPTQTTALNVSPKYPDGLTEREIEVLRLVASGLTDAQVAEQFVISPRTVQAGAPALHLQ